MYKSFELRFGTCNKKLLNIIKQLKKRNAYLKNCDFDPCEEFTEVH